MKTLGLIIIFSSSVVFGLFSSYTDKCSLVFMREILVFTEHIKEQIKHFNSPLFEIYNSFECKEKTMRNFLENINTYGVIQAVDDSKKNLSSEYYSLLKQFVSKLGKSNREDQVKLCEYYHKQLENEFIKQSKKLKTNSKLKITLSIYIGLLLIILLL